MNNESQLNGWFGKLLKKLIVFVADTIDNATLNMFDLSALANDIGTGPNANPWWNKIATSEPSPAEEIVLTNWTNSRFAPFVAKLAQRLLEMQSASSADNQIMIINEVKGMMCGVRSYFLTNETTGLTQVGIDTRTDLIDESFFMLLDKVDPILESIGIQSSQITIPSFGNVFGNLITSYQNIGPVYCDKYKPNLPDSEPVNVTEILQENLPVATTNQSTTTNNTASTDKSSPFKTLFIVGGLLTGIWLIFSKEE